MLELHLIGEALDDLVDGVVALIADFARIHGSALSLEKARPLAALWCDEVHPDLALTAPFFSR